MPKIVYVPKNFGEAAMAKINLCNSIIDEYAAQGFDLTLRQLYYQFVSRGYIANTLNEYKNLGVLVNDARLAGYIDWGRIVDRVRNLRKLPAWDSPESILESAADGFHMNRWETQENYVEVWIEKNALIGVIEPICDELDLPYFACIGYTSQSEMWTAARRLQYRMQQGKTPIILHLGDHDPSGIDMTRDIQERLELFIGTDQRAKGRRFQGIELQRLALNWDQVEQYAPPPNPAKLSDSRANAYILEYGDESWELDALDPTTIAQIIRTAVNDFIDWDKWAEIEEEETESKKRLQQVADRWNEVSDYLGEEEEDADE